MNRSFPLPRVAVLVAAVLLFLATGACLDRMAARRFGASWWGGREASTPMAVGEPEAEAPATEDAAGADEAEEEAAPDGAVPLRVLPAEFGELEALLLGCTHLFESAPEVFVQVTEGVLGAVPLFGLVNDAAEAEVGRALLVDHGLPGDAVRFLRLPTDTMWVRDFGPLFVARDDGRWGIVDASYSGFETPPERWRDDGAKAR